ncbi:hypothetical protein PMAYCL1PPCAC_27970, partial [Pristionchus mayeri]
MDRNAQKTDLPYHEFRHEQEILLVEGGSYTIDFFISLARTISIGQLSVMLDYRIRFHRQIYRLLKYFKVNTLILDSTTCDWASSMMTQKYLLELANTCEFLNATHVGRAAAPEVLLDLFEVMMSGRAILRCFMTTIVLDVWNRFHRLLGLAFGNGGVYCRNRRIPTFGCNGANGDFVWFFFVMNMEVSLTLTCNGGHILGMKVHKNQAS